MRQANEPSVEEILDSIKKVIARDNRVATESPTRRAASAPVIQDEEEDVLDLETAGEVVEEVAAEGPLLPRETVSSISESLAALAVMAEPRAAPQIVRSGETSLEGLTRELLRPALAEWLDKNLPPLVEKMVAAEIARIVGKRV
jgi:cell pole-organizing protein PopZ